LTKTNIVLDPSAAEFGRRRRKKSLSRKSAEKNSASRPPPKTRKFGGRRICDRLNDGYQNYLSFSGQILTPTVLHTVITSLYWGVLQLCECRRMEIAA